MNLKKKEEKKKIKVKLKNVFRVWISKVEKDKESLDEGF